MLSASSSGDGSKHAQSSSTAVDYIIKLGGSAITDKGAFETVNSDAIDNLCSQLQALAAIKPTPRMVIVHGAGSFGHFQAKKYKLTKAKRHEEWKFGAADTRRSVCSLNQQLVSALVKAGVKAVSVSPGSSWVTDGKVVVCHNLDLVQQLLQLDFVPVLHGDVVIDRSNEISILSGDTVMLELAKAFRPKRVVFVSDVDGVYTAPPGSSDDAKLVPHYVLGSGSDGGGGSDAASAVSITSAAHDVTGGLKGKLDTIVNLGALTSTSDATATATATAPSTSATGAGGAAGAMATTSARVMASLVSFKDRRLLEVCSAKNDSEARAVRGTHFVL